MSTPEAAAKKALDQLDNYNIGAAETTLTNALGKWGDNVDLLACHSLLLLRQKHVDEAAEKAKKIAQQLESGSVQLKEGPMNVLAHVLQNTCSYSELAKVYERSIALMGGPDHKDSTSAQENLLNAYILSDNLPAAQKLSVALQKKTGKHEYTIRGMMCNIAQVPESSSDHMLLKIATKMISNTLNNGQCLQPQPCQMYVNLLLQQKLFTDAINFVLSDKGKFIGLPEQRYSVLLKCLDAQLSHHHQHDNNVSLSVGIKAQVAAVARQAWLLDADNWSFADRYVRSVVFSPLPTAEEEDAKSLADFPRPKWSDAATSVPSCSTSPQPSSSSLSEWIADLELSAALAFISSQQTEKGRSASKCLRGPFMAEIALLLRELKESKEITESSEKKTQLVELIKEKAVAYARLFDSKGTCYLDLATLFAENACPAAVEAVVGDLKLQETERESKLSAAAAATTTTANSEREREVIALHNKRILRMKLQLLVTPVANPTEEAIDQLTSLIPLCQTYYDESRPYSTALEWSEEGKVDSYLLIIANIAIRQWYYYRVAAVGGDASASAGNPALVGMANRSLITALDSISKMDRKKNNPGTLLFSTLFNQQLGIADVPSLHQLDFKSIQHASMHHVACQPLLRGCAFAELKTYFEHAYDRYYALGKKEVSNLKAKIFQHLSWPKMGELARFEQRLLRGLPRQEALVFNALVKLRDTQTIKYTQSHAVNFAGVVEGALISVCMPSSSFLGYGDAPSAAAFASNPNLTILDLWRSILNDTDCNETVPEEDEQFLMAYLFADLRSEDTKALQNLLLDRDDRKWRRQQVVLGAIGIMLLHDVAIFEMKKAAASASANINSKNKIAAAAAQAAVSNPLAKKPFMSVKYGLTPENIASLLSTGSSVPAPANRYTPGSSSASGVGRATDAAMNAMINILSSLADVVAELTAAVSSSPSSAEAMKIALSPSSPARTRLVETLKTCINLKDLFDPSTGSANGADAVVNGGAFPLLFPLGIVLSSFFMLMPSPAEPAAAFRDGILKGAREVLTERVSALNEMSNGTAEVDAVTKYLSSTRLANVRSFSTLVDDLITDVNASSRRK